MKQPQLALETSAARKRRVKTEVATLPPASAVRTNPRIMRPAQTALRKIIAAAAALQRWEELEQAVDAQIEHQKEFVAWWQENVRRPGGDQSIVATTTTMLSVEDAEQETGITKEQVSRWRTALQDIDAYRSAQIQAARKRAVLEVVPRARGGSADEDGEILPSGGPHADCVQLERLARQWDDHALAAAIQRVIMAAFSAPDAPREAEQSPAKAAQRTIMELRRWATMIEQSKPAQ